MDNQLITSGGDGAPDVPLPFKASAATMRAIGAAVHAWQPGQPRPRVLVWLHDDAGRRVKQVEAEVYSTPDDLRRRILLLGPPGATRAEALEWAVRMRDHREDAILDVARPLVVQQLARRARQREGGRERVEEWRRDKGLPHDDKLVSEVLELKGRRSWTAACKHVAKQYGVSDRTVRRRTEHIRWHRP